MENHWGRISSLSTGSWVLKLVVKTYTSWLQLLWCGKRKARVAAGWSCSGPSPLPSEKMERGKISAVKLLTRTRFLWKALRELGPRYVGLYAVYQAGLRLGVYRHFPSKRSMPGLRAGSISVQPVLALPSPARLLDCVGIAGLEQLLREADEIVGGRVRLFGGDPTRMDLSLPRNLAHWTAYESGGEPLPQGVKDIKYLWEPARLGWVFILGRAYYLSGEQVYATAFWDRLEAFWDSNPPYLGPNWMSAQEAALRILALVYGAQVFATASATTPARMARLGESIAVHACRIPPTLCYARAQNNNHLLSEAVGMFTAALALPHHPQARRWNRLGHKWLRAGLNSQIRSDGAYSQHSTNYHRLMLHLALWVNALEPFQEVEVLEKLKAAASWLFTLTDLASGRAPNLGPNDGANILPLETVPFHDYRPVVQAACRAFTGSSAFPPGPWDELGLWLGIDQPDYEPQVSIRPHLTVSPAVVAHPQGDSWAYLRAAHFRGRPGHADQLHLDLWWRGFNVAQDAGTYLYNADLPWDNALTHTAVHNTVMVDSKEQMTRAGRFLYLDRAQAKIDAGEQAGDGSWLRITGRQDGYHRLGIDHQRSITTQVQGGWSVEDHLHPLHTTLAGGSHEIRLHWLLPDWEYKFQQGVSGLRVRSPFGWITLVVQAYGAEGESRRSPILTVQRAGQVCTGTGMANPTWGWVSPTYGVKEPALSLGFQLKAPLPLTLVTTWSFPHG
jgi:hypothetical protein